MRSTFILRGYFHRPHRTAAAVLGIALPVVAILIQFGFYDAVMTTSTQFYTHLHFDVALVSPDYLVFSRPGSIPRERLTQSLSVPGVEGAEPLSVAFLDWRNPRSGSVQQILVLAVDPERNPFLALSNTRQIALRDTVLFDRYSRPDLGSWRDGMVAELGDHAVRIADTFAFGPGFSALGLCVVSERTLESITGRPDRVSMGLVQTGPAEAATVTAARLRRILPEDVIVRTREQLLDQEAGYWRSATSLGINLTVGCGVSILVGIIVLYNFLSSDISSRLSEYATLKAMGYDDRMLASLVRLQAVGFALMALPISLVLADFGYRVTRHQTFLPVEMTWFRGTGVLALGLAMAALSAQFALRRLEHADPGDLF